MKTPTLIAVPKDGPTRKERLDQIKRTFGIETHRSIGWRRGENPWVAAHMPSARKMGYGVTEKSDLFDCISKVGRLMDESGIASYGDTEREAIRNLVENMNLPITL